MRNQIYVKAFDRTCTLLWKSSADFGQFLLDWHILTLFAQGLAMDDWLPLIYPGKSVLTEHGLVTNPFLCPWKAWPVLWVLPRNEWLHSGPDHAVGVPLFPWLMGLGCWTASRRSLLTWSDSVGDCQGPVASAASRDSCKEREASLKYTDPCLYNWPTTATLVTWLKLFSAADVPLSKAFNNP